MREAGTILVAPDSFKGSLAAPGVARALADGIRTAMPEANIVTLPVADGGEGTVDTVVAATNGTRVTVDSITNPLGRKISSFYGVTGDGTTAVIEMAAASGLPLLAEREQNPLLTTTYGTGELIRAALDAGYRRIIVGVGGSATTDGGIGAAQALGVEFFDRQGNVLDVPAAGKDMEKIADYSCAKRIPELDECELFVACDVDNPLLGERGAAQVYSPQKGAREKDIARLENGLATLGRVVQQRTGNDLSPIAGAGAAGGLGFGLAAWCGASLEQGAELVFDTIDFNRYIEGAVLVVTGEGSLNRQTLYGKAPLLVARKAKSNNVPVIFVAGTIEEIPKELYAEGVSAVFSISRGGMSLEESKSRAPELLTATAQQIFNLIRTLKD